MRLQGEAGDGFGEKPGLLIGPGTEAWIIGDIRSQNGLPRLADISGDAFAASQ